MPIEFKDYADFRANIELQSLQICECVDLIVGDEIDDEYKIFRTRLLNSKTMYVLYVLIINMCIFNSYII